MRSKNKVILLLFMLVCMMCATLRCCAADDLLGTVVDGSLLTDEIQAEGIAFPLLRGTYLSSGSGTILVTAPHQLTIGGTTSAHKTCDKVKVTLHLQRLQNGSWNTIQTYGPTTANNTYYVSMSRTVTVTGGYYYRVMGGHIAIKGSVNEAIASTTDGIWVY